MKDQVQRFNELAEQKGTAPRRSAALLTSLREDFSGMIACLLRYCFAAGESYRACFLGSGALPHSSESRFLPCSEGHEDVETRQTVEADALEGAAIVS